MDPNRNLQGVPVNITNPSVSLGKAGLLFILNPMAQLCTLQVFRPGPQTDLDPDVCIAAMAILFGDHHFFGQSRCCTNCAAASFRDNQRPAFEKRGEKSGKVNAQ